MLGPGVVAGATVGVWTTGGAAQAASARANRQKSFLRSITCSLEEQLLQNYTSRGIKVAPRLGGRRTNALSAIATRFTGFTISQPWNLFHGGGLHAPRFENSSLG